MPFLSLSPRLKKCWTGYFSWICKCQIRSKTTNLAASERWICQNLCVSFITLYFWLDYKIQALFKHSSSPGSHTCKVESHLHVETSVVLRVIIKCIPAALVLARSWISVIQVEQILLEDEMRWKRESLFCCCHYWFLKLIQIAHSCSLFHLGWRFDPWAGQRES